MVRWQVESVHRFSILLVHSEECKHNSGFRQQKVRILESAVVAEERIHHV
jgi:hypothetical protein